MKTSLNILRATNACTGGFGRQASFWTVRPKAKAIEYPIWMVGLTGTYDDMQWAIQNSLIVVDEDFKELKARTFWPMFQYLFWSSIDASYILKMSEKKAGDFQRDALQEALGIRNAEQAQAWMDKYSRYRLCTALFSNVANNACWTNPQDYLNTLTLAIQQEKTETCKQHEHLPFDLDKHVPGHDSRTGRAKKAVPSRTAARRYRDDDEEPSQTNDVSNSYFDMPKRASGRVVTKGEQFAYVCLNRDPWPVALQFLMDNDVPKVIGSKMMLSKVSEEGKEPEQFHASLNLHDPRTIFTLLHLLQGQDFDIFKAMHVEQKMGRLERVLRNNIGGNSMDDLDTAIDDPDGDYRDAQQNIISEMTSAEANIAEQGPTGGAIRERRINTSASGEDSWESEEAANRRIRVTDADEEEDDEESSY